MKKLFLISFILTTSLFGYSYNELLIKAQSNIFPKILLLDKKLNDKLVDGKVVYTIVCENNDYQMAQEVRELLEARYQNRLGEYELQIEIKRYDELTPETRATALYALNSDKGIEKLNSVALSSGCVTFAYDIGNLKRGVLLSLMIEKSTVLYLNKEGLQHSHIDFVESLYQIVKFANN